VAERLEEVTDLVGGAGVIERLRPLGGRQIRFGLADLSAVTVDTEGQVRQVRPGGGRGTGIVESEVLFTLPADQLEPFLAGETVILRGTGSSQGEVIGIRHVPQADGPPGQTLAVLGTQGVVTIGPQARLWFLVSAVIVLVGSMLAAWLLAARLVRPIEEMQRATASIAGGDFAVRVAATGRDEVADLGRSINGMAQELERSKLLDQQFLMSVSHDLRTPLTAISGYAEALRDGTATDAAGAGEVIGNHAGRLERLVGDLLDLAKLDAKRFTLAPQALDLGVAVGRSVAGMQPRSEQHGVSLEFHHQPGITVAADPHRLEQVVDNVLVNAITFAASRIVTTVAADGSTAIITISDDGPGIAAEDLPHVFERLYVARSQPERAENPTGMGLAIVRELTMAMGGSVTAEQPAGGGTTIVLRLPRSPVPTHPAP
jgi:signal transduction histidine kinase